MAVALLFLLTSTAFAQRELRIKALPETALPWVRTVVVPFAHCAAVSDVAKVLAVGKRFHNTGILAISPPPGTPAPLLFFRLNDQGDVIPGDPVTVELPKPPALGSRTNYAVGMVPHPTLPLLYVWQDVPVEPDQTAVDPALAAEFDHLLVYSLEESPPKLVFATARGNDYRTGNNSGGFALDKPARRLYVPSMNRLDALKKVIPAIGWLRLAPDGLPEFRDPTKPDEAPPAPAPAMDAAAAAASRAARLAQWDQAKAAGMPLVPARYAESALYSFGLWPCPDSYAPLSDDVVVTASYSGPVSWVLSDQAGRFGTFYLTPYIPYRYRLCAHPSQPSAYVSVVTYDGRLIRMELADGYFTGTPQVLTVDGLVAYSPPIVLPKTNQLVVGGNGWLCVVALGAEGRLTEHALHMSINNPAVEALAWSEKLERLYVPIEKAP